ncbi:MULTISPECIES: ABC transporter substrate-binding protein [Brucella]|jgi:glucose/mannose transport system substrate-binding protein|uniref:Probable sugar-binding periplasmic protein n=1 Tax=Brucella pseudogrignonensis TaxID=419475 RepID=A0A1A9FPR0_9HYPH|nr:MULTISPECIES: ABC transporter substrate-binding protein [Brucella]EMG52325.1 extracellular solute-binding protein [Ochrobactrum sp. CDB2]MBO1025805.1 carbohydrate ABC transporter substrate-binding protein [Ochrobactrum sp. SD129]MQP40774.1 extracellular solute-binding protein [Ochrobactrum sp. MYb237]ANG97596.1 sugar ABC transporter substrate-binding protein [Brucella pseudogrignonensis]KAB2688190.1 carbohydrate ABC transporter substrate-binding protein [Brucella pseudogrignonensis]
MHKFFRMAAMGTAACAMLAAMAPVTASAQDKQNVEVLHWWTAGGEAAALDVLKKDLEGKGISWTDMPVAGGGGTEAMTVLRARVTAGNAPTAVQMLGFDIRDWAEQGALGNLDEIAGKEGWDKVIPAPLQEFAKYDGHWIAAPVNVHSTNWMWINKAALDKAGGKEPTNWDELVALLDKFKEQGITPIAHGGQPWQDATIFDAVVLSFGPDFYKKAFVDLDPEALGSDTMKQAFDRMTKLRSYVDDNFSGRDWNLASAMVIEGKAGVQFMGDWAKGEFVKAGKKPGEDFVCMRYPETQGSVTFNSDMFAMFKVAEDKVPAQLEMASAIESPAFQSAFNVVKGSAPARTDVPDTDFDACGKKAIADVKEAAGKGTMLGSMAHGYANPASVKNAIYDVVTRQFNGQLSSEDAVKELVSAVEGAK